MTVSDKPWSQFTPADYGEPQRFCYYSLINDNVVPKGQWVAEACKLPVYEPDGTLNRNAVHAAAAALAGARGGVHSSAQAKRAAARKLIGLYGRIGEEVPDTIRRIAGS
jgi:hypothetical protein